ncbi:hypothetical protein AMECASPLE_011952 [Ameca splendens]|uniref:Uncharacterized protein n=1 Tax=Ameca splendens TaxID=208324 RepID=A0ABV0Z9T1_9TELE
MGHDGNRQVRLFKDWWLVIIQNTAISAPLKTTVQPHTHTKPINLVIFLDYGRKPEHLEGTPLYTGRTCKLHSRPQARIQTQDLHATRQKCYQLRHHGAL